MSNEQPEDDRPSAPNSRSFSLNSREFYEAVTPPPDPWVWAGGLPKEPKPRDPEMIIEREARKR